MRNDKRILSNLVMINIKCLKYELSEISASDADRKIPYTLKQVLDNDVDSIFIRISRLMFESSYENVEFVNDLIHLIIKKLYRCRKDYSDGVTIGADADLNEDDTDDEDHKK